MPGTTDLRQNKVGIRLIRGGNKTIRGAASLIEKVHTHPRVSLFSLALLVTFLRLWSFHIVKP